MKQQKSKILIFSAHPDDAELGMGGTIAHLLSRGAEVKVVDLTNGEPTPKGSIEIRMQESLDASKSLGFEREILDYDNRNLIFSIEKRDRIAGIIRKFRPDGIFVHYYEDSHPDHRETAKIVQDSVFAARLTKTDFPGEPYRAENLYFYYAVHLRKVEKPDFFIRISEKEYQKKVRALKCYKSQFIDNKKNEKVIEKIKTRDSYWGFLVKSNYAEGFKTRGEIGLNNINCLL
ncbi:MAG: bacillithiol biosynthesis deacetylase BshB1 [Elusimicrobiota bacterium]